MAENGQLVRIDAPHFVAGILIENDHVVRGAPIIAWMIGKPEGFVEWYCRRKGWLFDRVPSANSPCRTE
jgi:hypothetical protein